MKYRVCRTFLAKNKMHRPGELLPDDTSSDHLAHYLKSGMVEQMPDDDGETETEAAKPAAKKAAKPKTTKPAKPAETT
jgi:hypothetical protein